MSDELNIETKINIVNSHIMTVKEYLYNYDLEIKIINDLPEDQRDQSQIDQFNQFKVNAYSRLATLEAELALLTQN